MGRVIGLAVLVATLVLGACSGGADAGGATTSTSAPDIPSTTQPQGFTTSSVSPEAAISTTRILLVGNSFTSTGGVWVLLGEFAASATPPIPVEIELSTWGGATLESHWKSTQTPEWIASYDYDIVVLQGDIPETDVETFKQNARNLVEAAREAGAEPILFMAWSYERLGWFTMDEIAQAHADIATELGVDVAPVGLAFERASDERPSMDMLSSDKEHQSIFGAYLLAHVIYMTMFGKDNPAGLTYVPAGISDEEAAFLQRIARETVSEYTANRTS